MSELKRKGLVVKYDQKRKFGFIKEHETKLSYFFHISNLNYLFRIDPLATEVSFIASKNPNGLVAIEVEEIKTVIEGKFSKIEFDDIERSLTNVERLEFLEDQYRKINILLYELKVCGINTNTKNEWISIDTSISSMITEPSVKHHIKEVPSGYISTAKYLFNALERQLNRFNKDYVSTKKGILGEEKTLYSLRSVALDYPILSNIRFELVSDTMTYSSESDVIVFTDRAIFVIETKNYGKKGDTINVSKDGLWTISNSHTNKIRALKNPFKQSTDHIFAIKKFFKTKESTIDLPILPIIAISNDDVLINVDSMVKTPIIRADMIGTYILEYMNATPALIEKKDLMKIKAVLDNANLPPKQYPVIDYYKNIEKVCVSIKELIEYWLEDEHTSERIREQKREKEREEKERIRKEKEREEMIRAQKEEAEKLKAEKWRERKETVESIQELLGTLAHILSR